MNRAKLYVQNLSLRLSTSLNCSLYCALLMTSRVLNPIRREKHCPLIRPQFVRAVAVGLVSLCLAFSSRSLAQTNDPVITTQPMSGVVMLGEDWGFNVEVTGTPPFTYQWRQNGIPIPELTNSFVEIDLVENFHAGTFTVVIDDAQGQVISDEATLTISDTPPRTIRNGPITGNGSATIPMIFASNGRETSISFSLSYDTNVFANPSWVGVLSNATSVINTTEANNGHVGLTVSLPGRFAPTNNYLGDFTFDFALTNDPFAAMLQFTNTPTAFQGINTNGTTLQMRGGIIPHIDLVDASPILNLQSGLMEQQLTISYAGALTITNVDIAVANLLVDSLTNAVTLYNAVGTNSFDLTGYGDVQELPYADAGVFGPGTKKLLTMEYYVSDRVTVPAPEYYLDLGEDTPFNVPAAATPLDISIARYLDGTYVIQFDSVSGFVYYVQYAESVEDLENIGPTSRVVEPPVIGNGYSMQWIDNGPPKTESHPIDGMRFYRVVELPIN